MTILILVIIQCFRAISINCSRKPKVETIFKNAVLKIDYGIDLSHLKNSKWVR